MKLTRILLTTAVSCLLIPNSVSASNIYVVPATANIFSAGLSTPMAPGGGGAGTLPVQIAVTPGLGIFQFQYVSGSVSPNDGQFSLDGDGTPQYPTDINPYGGVSGFISDQAFPLVGVFLPSATPQPPPPPTLDFSAGAIGRNFLSLSPLIGQVFLIGDGVTDANQTRTYYAPAGATELYLGFGDAYYFEGDAGQYQDNVGSLNIAVTAVPEPAPTTLLLAGSALMAAIRCRNKR